jgi:glutathione synthase/RimK-type ligase-like ATP-grasp enzyme
MQLPEINVILTDMPKIAFATDSEHSNLTADDSLAAEALRARGIEVIPAVWNSPAIRWKAFDAIVVRSTWDYAQRLGEFVTWVGRMELEGARLFNASSILWWNSSKIYLQELERSRVPIVPTRWMTAEGTAEMLRKLEGEVALLGLGAGDRFVVKPAVSAGGKRTHRFDAALLGGSTRGREAERARLESALADFEPRTLMMVQPYLPEIESDGEWSFLFFGGRFSHAVQKRPAAGGFLVQTHQGGSLAGAEPPAGAVEWAAGVLATAESLRGERTLYARVDAVRAAVGAATEVMTKGWLLGELELLEPSLYFEHGAASAGLFAEALAHFLNTA